MANNFVWKNVSMMVNIAEASTKADAAIKMLLETEANRLRDYAQHNAPWTDRTSQARRSIGTEVSKINSGYRITLAHGVDYGIWLELCNEKRYAIVLPTIEALGPKVLEDFKGLLSKIF